MPLQCMAYIDNQRYRGTIMAPTKTANISLIDHYTDIYKAMLDELPPHVWLELYDIIKPCHYYAFELQECTSFKVVE